MVYLNTHLLHNYLFLKKGTCITPTAKSILVWKMTTY